MPALPYASGDDENGMPVGAIRSMLRMPMSEAAVPLAIPRRTPQTMAPPSVRPPPPEMDFQQPNWGRGQSEWGGLLGGLSDMAAKYRKSVDDQKLAEAIAELKRSRETAPTDTGSWKNSAAPSQDVTDVPMSGYRANARRIESAGDDNAINPGSGATGRYQFLPSTAKDLMDANPHLGLKMEDLKKPEVQEMLMTLYTDRSVKALKPLLGREPTPGELYLTHLLGHSGGPAVLSNLDKPISETVDPRVYEANKSLLSPHRTGRQLVAYFNRRLGG